MHRGQLVLLGAACLALPFTLTLRADQQAGQAVDLQPFAAQVRRLAETLDYVGAPLSAQDRAALDAAIHESDKARALAASQAVLDRLTLFDVHINPESRVRVTAGAARPQLVQNGWRTFLVKVRNEAGVTAALKVDSPQARTPYYRPRGGSFSPRPPQTLKPGDVADRWLDLSLFDKPPLTPTLSGLEVEYRILQLYSRDAGRREATVSFNVGQGSQDIGFRNDAPILFQCLPAKDVTLRVLDQDGRPTTASFVIRDSQGHVYPAPAKRLAPDFAFHPQVYRADGEHVTLPAGRYDVEFTRGPEYLTQHQPLIVIDPEPNGPATATGGRAAAAETATFRLKRWIDVASRGWYPGDHHIHAAGCLHYESPTEGVMPEDMMRHILGEGLSVGSVLTWGPGYYFQKKFFSGLDHPLSNPEHLMHYDLEVSGFPSSHSGHLVLLQLKDQDYPGTKELEDWPTWDLPILKWAKAQGAVVGFAHSGWGLEVKATTLPTLEMPAFDGIGANEFIVDVTHDAVDFISTMDTPPVWELNIWYHTLNTGFRTRIGGETDFPCIFGDRVGLGRSYVQLRDKLTYASWTDGLRDGRAYVSDGRSHLLDFRVNGQLVGTNGSELRLRGASTVRVSATVAARLDETPDVALRTRRADEKPYWHLERARIDDTRDVPVEVIVNGERVATSRIVADGTPRDLSWDIPIARSSWIAIRILPSSHTNPVFALVDDKPVRASRDSAEWCLKAVDQCWRQKAPGIAAAEQSSAEEAYEHARRVYRERLAESGRD